MNNIQSNNVCQFDDFSMDSYISNILTGKNKIELSMYFAKLIAQKKNSSAIILPVFSGVEKDAFKNRQCAFNEIEDLLNINRSLINDSNIQILIEQIKNNKNSKIVYKMQGAFSILVELLGAKKAFIWIKKHKDKVSNCLGLINKALIEYAITINNIGVKVISYSDPSGTPGLLGDKLYLNCVAIHNLEFLEEVSKNGKGLAVHICPRTSYPIDRLCLMDRESIRCKMDNIIDELFYRAANNKIVITGNQCINKQNTTIEYLDSFTVI